MKYNIGNKVELDNGCIVEITNIHNNLLDGICLFGGTLVLKKRVV